MRNSDEGRTKKAETLMMSMKEKIAKSLSDQDQMFKNFRNLDLNVCIENEDWISSGRLFHKFFARGKNEHNDRGDDLFTRGTG